MPFYAMTCTSAARRSASNALHNRGARRQQRFEFRFRASPSQPPRPSLVIRFLVQPDFEGGRDPRPGGLCTALFLPSLLIVLVEFSPRQALRAISSLYEAGSSSLSLSFHLPSSPANRFSILSAPLRSSPPSDLHLYLSLHEQRQSAPPSSFPFASLS
jgi:hypothetical protein